MNKTKLSEAINNCILRRWQGEAIKKALEHLSENDVFVAEVVTGGGKTYFAGILAATMVRDYGYEEITIMTPSSAIKDGWAESMNSIGFTCTSSDYETAGQNAFSVTYSGAFNKHVIEKIDAKKRRILIVDEFHHGERDEMWGDAIEYFHERSQKTLFLSGTPWRSGGKIPILDELDYYDNGAIKPDYPHRYAKDLCEADEDRATVYAEFMFFDSRARIKGDKDFVEFKAPKAPEEFPEYADNNCNDPLGIHVRVANSQLSNNNMAMAMVKAGGVQLAHSMNETKNRAMGLIVASRKTEAHCIAEFINESLGQTAEVIVSDDDKASDRLRTIRTSPRNERPDWIVSVGMVSEGVDIPELKVIVYLSAILTMLYLIQVLGRVLRRIKRQDGTYIDSSPGQTPGYVIMPAHPKLVWLGLQFENDKRVAALKAKKKTKSDPNETEQPIETENLADGAHADLISGNVLPPGLTRKYRMLLDDRDAIDVITPSFAAWIRDLCRNKKIDEAESIIDKYINLYEIEIGIDDEFNTDLDYDTRLRLVRKDAQRLAALIRFSHPLVKDIKDDGKAFAKARSTINKMFTPKLNFNKATLEQKEEWVVLADRFYQAGLSRG